ncbi:ABC transporter ATP-binding protein [Lihuaxuella thermophila]|uniref:ABC-2 type transport system ATP-binding protein n=1 Tax=Lihuaxuella thermophila TaxID=1173111 RepID=A0A1H8HEX1_9BACL|nr:ABC transporter ATP-binding protein [Lihuaxuella thermophila]SEN54812.1 ABC-2 type transport system ATP-binding protein [Lihuaxuella thermophila]
MIRTENLCKSYGKFEALKNLNLTVDKGTVYGFIGPNGAGKSTTMQILATLLKPTSGRAWVGNLDVVEQADEVRRIIGYMPDFFGVYDNLTSLEYLEFYAACYGIHKHLRRKIGLELLELVGLAEKQDTYVDSLSRGMKQRLGLARTLVHDPELLILDEPASGLDPRARIEFREILKELRVMGKTIMISSHILPELASLCDVIGVMDQGELVASGSVEEITAHARQGRTLEIRVLGGLEEAKEYLETSPQVLSVHLEQEKILAKVSGDESVQVELLSGLVSRNIPVVRFSETSMNIEDVFLQVTRDSQGGKEHESIAATVE